MDCKTLHNDIESEGPALPNFTLLASLEIPPFTCNCIGKDICENFTLLVNIR